MMTNRRMAHRSRKPDGQVLVLFLLVALLAYSGLWLSERIAIERTLSSLPARQHRATLGHGASVWAVALRNAPSADPRRVVALTRRSGSSRHEAYPGDAIVVPSRSAIQATDDSWFLAVGVAP